jgi:hypothetical protein
MQGVRSRLPIFAAPGIFLQTGGAEKRWLTHSRGIMFCNATSCSMYARATQVIFLPLHPHPGLSFKCLWAFGAAWRNPGYVMQQLSH